MTLGFDITQAFTHAQTIWDTLKPVAYLSVGIGLGFVMFRIVKSII